MTRLVVTRRTILGAAAATAAGGLLGRAGAEEPVKGGWVYVGPVGDFGYSYQHDQGRKAVEEHFGGKVKTSFVENVPEGPDAERVIRQLATAGNQIVFATSFGFMNACERVAKALPKNKFEHATGYKRAANLATYNARFYEGRYLTGIIAGRMSKSGVIGYVAAFPIPEVVQGINAILLGARSVNAQAAVKVVWTSSW